MWYDEIMAKVRNAQPFEISPNEAGRLAREAMEAKAAEARRTGALADLYVEYLRTQPRDKA